MKNTTQFHIRPARPEEAGLFYTPHPGADKFNLLLKALYHIKIKKSNIKQKGERFP